MRVQLYDKRKKKTFIYKVTMTMKRFQYIKKDSYVYLYI